MSVKILDSLITSLDIFSADPEKVFKSGNNDIISVFHKNMLTPIFYAVTPEKMAKLLAFENMCNISNSEVVLKDCLLNDKKLTSSLKNISIPLKKFAMYVGWQPDKDFLRMAAMWGYNLTCPVNKTELASFVDYWQAEEKVFYHIQWQQKLARSIQQYRIIKGATQIKKDINYTSEQYCFIPQGFRG
ncbi:Primosomal protein 1 [Candidatus Profftia lariciata]|uniref:primosomal protein DnaT n=1 Tax=Candidatus Profftia lariciata TaxID=1987921 RepID=UPI001D00842B|nr:primosomal protein DnaT [Candidatus Profftia lariciata]UDG81453.1 Primosomal protein 1 [Candidatus Profftia lariciata]